MASGAAGNAADMESTPLPKLPAPARRALDAAGIATLEDLGATSRVHIATLHGIGANALATLDRALEDSGLHFAGHDHD